jgi:hypothetical protein
LVEFRELGSLSAVSRCAQKTRKKTPILVCFFLQLPLRFAGAQADESGDELCPERDRTPSANINRP